MRFFIRATGPARRATWSSVFGRETLPLKRPFTRASNDGQPVCDIDLASCHPLAVNRLAVFLAGHRGERPQILAELRAGGVALPAASCELLDGAAVDLKPKAVT